MCGPALGFVTSVLGLGSKSKTDTSAVTPAPTSVGVTSGSDAIDSAKSAKKKAAAASGQQSTIGTSSSGDTSTATTSKKSLLGN
jgi:hypothetical protein